MIMKETSRLSAPGYALRSKAAVKARKTGKESTLKNTGSCVDNPGHYIEKRIPPPRRHILSDELIVLAGDRADRCPDTVRLVRAIDPKTGNIIDLLTNNLELGASTISGIYRERWRIEEFFRLLKQNLKIKTFIGTSENALLTQIWTALTSLLLLKWLHFISKSGWSFSNLASMLRMNLFTHRNLLEWLDDPYGSPPLEPVPEQLSLKL